MQFPVSIVVIEDLIVLCQSEITQGFKDSLNRVDYVRLGVMSIRSSATPSLELNRIWINGHRNKSNYRFVSVPYTERLYQRYTESIEIYKRELGYE